jgi:hypothetical protein
MQRPCVHGTTMSLSPQFQQHACSYSKLASAMPDAMRSQVGCGRVYVATKWRLLCLDVETLLASRSASTTASTPSTLDATEGPLPEGAQQTLPLARVPLALLGL